MKKIISIFCVTVIMCLSFIGCSNSSAEQSTKSATQKQSVQNESAKKGPTQAELNTQLKKDATKADFVQLNGYENQYKDKKVYVEGTVSFISQTGAPGGEFDVKVQEGNGYGDYGITSLDTEHNYNIGKDIVEGSKVKAYGTVEGKNSEGMPHIVAVIIEKE